MLHCCLGSRDCVLDDVEEKSWLSKKLTWFNQAASQWLSTHYRSLFVRRFALGRYLGHCEHDECRGIFTIPGEEPLLVGTLEH